MEPTAGIGNTAMMPIRRQERDIASSEWFFVALVALTVLVGIAAYQTITINDSLLARSYEARLSLQALVETTLDETTGVRRFAATGEPRFLYPYREDRNLYSRELGRLDTVLSSTDMADAVARFNALHAVWQQTILEPLREHPKSALATRLLKQGKPMLLRLRAIAAGINEELKQRTVIATERANETIVISILTIVLLTIGLGLLSVRSERRRLAEEARLRADIAAQNEALERSNQSLQEFAYVASHDLQEPLRTVASFTQLLQKRYAGKLDAQADEFISFAVDGALRMQHLINDILQYSRVTTHGRAFERVSLADAVERACVNLRSRIEQSGAEIDVGAMPEVWGDSTQLSQLFTNLLGNGLKYNQSLRPRIEISARRDGDQWEIRVSDNGIGIAPEFHERIFGIFTRLHTRDEYEGTGIGLALCRRILERHNGRIWLQSAEGSGTTFYCTIPAEKS
ncbi:MAG: sensor histidine kinase [Vulcanimicrobiaceae bacterium]